MGMGDLLSLRQLDLPVKIIVFKNDSLAFVELEMKATGILDFGTDLANPDFAKMAEAAGLLGLTATRPEHVRPCSPGRSSMTAPLWSRCSCTGGSSPCRPGSASSR